MKIRIYVNSTGFLILVECLNPTCRPPTERYTKINNDIPRLFVKNQEEGDF